MMQAADHREAATQQLCSTLHAVTTGTKHEGTFNKNYVVGHVTRDHLEMFNSVGAKNDEDRHVEWLT